MPSWTLEKLSARFSPLNTTANFGHNFHANYLMKYSTDAFGKFVETPKLDWHEKVIKAELNDGEWHEYELNMYTLKPNSKTLEIWSRRYIEAYLKAFGRPTSPAVLKGSSTLLDKSGMPVPGTRLEKNLSDGGKQADAVRSYLKRYGGILSIEVHDIPSISLPLQANRHTERLLIFNVGVENGALRQQAEQYLNVDANTPQANWTQHFALNWAKSWSSRGLRKVQAPGNLTTPVAPVWKSGECW